MTEIRTIVFNDPQFQEPFKPSYERREAKYLPHSLRTSSGRESHHIIALPVASALDFAPGGAGSPRLQ